MMEHGSEAKNLELFVGLIRGLPEMKPFKMRLELKNNGTEKSKA